MIVIEKTDRRAIYFLFDELGAKELTSAFRSHQQVVAVHADERLWKGRRARRGGFREVMLVVVNDETRDRLIAEPEQLVLFLDAASIEMIAARLQAAAPQGFFPAEMAEVLLGEDGSELVTLYGKLTTPHELAGKASEATTRGGQ
ncbi:hypothetical protein [Sorangium sp. So ce1182]|uniref:hypothetical protein n=1 Tax=Sorangium sp. So ce1182 TaxID=3133334 RepID=UPI003F5F52E1